MRKSKFPKIGIAILFIFSVFSFQINTNAAGGGEITGYNIIPELSTSEVEEIDTAIQQIGSAAQHVMDQYNKQANERQDSPSKQIASGIMTRDTILDYLQYVVRFLSELGIVVGVGFIIYAGYKYMVSVFTSGNAPTNTIKNAIIGVIIIIFSYAILKTLTSLVGIS